MLIFRCTQCDFEKQVGQSLLGRKARCPRCKTINVISEPVPQSSSTQGQEFENWITDLKEVTKETYPASPELEMDWDNDFETSGNSEISERGIPAPRSFLTTALISGLFFAAGMGTFIAIQSSVTTGIMMSIIIGPLCGLSFSLFMSGRKVVIRFSERKRFLKELKQAFAAIKYQMDEANDPVFVFEHEQGGLMMSIHVHVGKQEAICVGPRYYVKKCMKRLQSGHHIDWSGKKIKETHGKPVEDQAANIVWGVVLAGICLIALVVQSGISPEGKARHYVRNRLKSPSAAVFHSTKIVRKNEEGTIVEVVYEAPNSFGVMLKDSMTILVRRDGSIKEY